MNVWLLAGLVWAAAGAFAAYNARGLGLWAIASAAIGLVFAVLLVASIARRRAHHDEPTAAPDQANAAGRSPGEGGGAT